MAECEAKRGWALVAGILLVTLGGCVMVGWLLDVSALKEVSPGLVSMKFNTALGFALLGGGIIAGPRSRVTLAVIVAVGAFSALTLVEYATSWSFGIDEAVFRDAATVGSEPGRMAVTTARVPRARRGRRSPSCGAVVDDGSASPRSSS